MMVALLTCFVCHRKLNAEEECPHCLPVLDKCIKCGVIFKAAPGPFVAGTKVPEGHLCSQCR